MNYVRDEAKHDELRFESRPEEPTYAEGEITAGPGRAKALLTQTLPEILIPFLAQIKGEKEWRSPETFMEGASFYATGKLMDPAIAGVAAGIKKAAPFVKKVLGKEVAPATARRTGMTPALQLKDGKIVEGRVGQHHYDMAEEAGIHFDQVQDKGFMDPEKGFMPKSQTPESVNPQNEFLRIGDLGKIGATKHASEMSDQALQSLVESNGLRWKGRAQSEKDLVHYSLRAAMNIRHRAGKPETDLPKMQAKNPHYQDSIEDLQDLAKSMPKISMPHGEHFKQELLHKWEIISEPKETLEQSFTTLKESFNKVWKKYTGVPVGSDWDTMIRSYAGELQESAYNGWKFAKKLIAQIPSRLHREAMINYIQADGNMQLLAQRARTSMANPKTEKYASGYRAAMKLPKDLQQWAKNIRTYFDDVLDKAIDAGMLKEGIDDYLPQLHKGKISTSARKLYGEVNAGILKKDPFFAKQRIYDSYFESEQAGFAPRNKDIGYLVTVYDRAFNQAIAARKFLKELTEGKASDGSPLVHAAGYVKDLPKGTVVPEAHLIKPRGTPEEFYKKGYVRPPDHSAFRKWKWVGKGADGAPIFQEGDLYMHPEFATKLKNAFTKSYVRTSLPGRLALQSVANFKGILLGFSGFHQFQVGAHAVFHGVNPFSAPPINIEDPITKSLIRAGMLIHDYRGENLFAEGVGLSGGIMRNVPFLNKYTDYLFKDYIPRVKAEMARHALKRNIGRYGKGAKNPLSMREIYQITADQANAAFGEQNYLALGRSMGRQDIARLLLLAPDFLEARARFAGQALRPYGQGLTDLFLKGKNEQFMAAVVRASMGIYGGCRVMNMILNDGDPKWDKPFAVKVGPYDITFRSVPADVYHLLSDPQNFVYYRISPTFAKPIVEWAQARTRSGESVTADKLIRDTIIAHIPIPFQRRSDAKAWQQLMSAFGVSAYTSRTAFEKELLSARAKRSTFTPHEEDKARHKLMRKFGKELREAKTPTERREVLDKMKVESRAGNLFAEDFKKVQQRSLTDDIAPALKQMDMEDIIPIWPKASAEEKRKYLPMIAHKIAIYAQKHPEKYKEFMPKLQEMLKEAKNKGIENKLTSKQYVRED